MKGAEMSGIDYDDVNKQIREAAEKASVAMAEAYLSRIAENLELPGRFRVELVPVIDTGKALDRLAGLDTD